MRIGIAADQAGSELEEGDGAADGLESLLSLSFGICQGMSRSFPV